MIHKILQPFSVYGIVCTVRMNYNLIFPPVISYGKMPLHFSVV